MGEALAGAALAHENDRHPVGIVRTLGCDGCLLCLFFFVRIFVYQSSCFLN